MKVSFFLANGTPIYRYMVLEIGVGDPINREGIDLNYDSSLNWLFNFYILSTIIALSIFLWPQLNNLKKSRHFILGPNLNLT